MTDAKYADFKNAPCPPELSGGTATAPGGVTDPAGTPGGRSPAFCDISGQILPGISKLALSWGGEFNVPVASGKAYVGYDGSYRSKFSSNPSRSAYMDIQGYSLSNLRAGLPHRQVQHLRLGPQRFRPELFRTAQHAIGQHRADRRTAGRSADVRRDGPGEFLKFPRAGQRGEGLLLLGYGRKAVVERSLRDPAAGVPLRGKTLTSPNANDRTVASPVACVTIARQPP